MSKLLQYLKDRGLNDITARQYYLQVNKFLVDNNIKNPVLFAQKTDKEILRMAETYCNRAKNVYIRKYAILKLFQFLEREDLEKEFRKIIKGRLPLKDSSKGDRAISIEELKMIIKDLPYRYGLIVKLMFWGAFRINEVLKLKKGNLKQIEKRIRITVKGKGDKKLVVFMPENVSKELIIYTNKICGTDRSKKLFEISYEHFDYILRKVSKEAIGYPVTSHEVGKHSRGHWELIEQKTPLNRIQKILHHSNITTTLRYLSDSGVESKEIIKERENKINL
jgi:integrase